MPAPDCFRERQAQLGAQQQEQRSARAVASAGRGCSGGCLSSAASYLPQQARLPRLPGQPSCTSWEGLHVQGTVEQLVHLDVVRSGRVLVHEPALRAVEDEAAALLGALRGQHRRSVPALEQGTHGNGQWPPATPVYTTARGCCLHATQRVRCQMKRPGSGCTSQAAWARLAPRAWSWTGSPSARWRRPSGSAGRWRWASVTCAQLGERLAGGARSVASSSSSHCSRVAVLTSAFNAGPEH